jgi:hypothetical protein
VILVDYGDFDNTYTVGANSETSFAISVTEGVSLAFTLPTWGVGSSELMAVWIASGEAGGDWVIEVNDLPSQFSFNSPGGKPTFTCTL